MRTEAGLPTLRQLELLVALSGASSIAAAGTKAGMSASATSHALRALETALRQMIELGVRSQNPE